MSLYNNPELYSSKENYGSILDSNLEEDLKNLAEDEKLSKLYLLFTVFKYRKIKTGIIKMLYVFFDAGEV